MTNNNLVFSNYVSTSDLGFFEMTVSKVNGKEIGVFCGGSKELQSIEKRLSKGENLNNFKSYLS